MKLKIVRARFFLTAAALAVVACVLPARSPNQTLASTAQTPSSSVANNPGPEGYEGKTVPFMKSEMSLTQKITDVVLDVKVKPGDFVKAGDVLAILDDSEEQANLRVIELQAGSDVAIKAANVTRENKEVEFDRVKDQFNKKVASQSEFDKARLDFELSKLDIEKAQLDQEKLKREVTVQKARIEHMRLVTKISGIVKEINIEKGAVIDSQKPAIIIVNNNPLWVEVNLPTVVSLELLKQQRARPDQKIELGVLFPGSQQSTPAKIIFFSPEADAASSTQLVRLELNNEAGMPSGIHVQVTVPQAAKIVEASAK